jgi:hypothetical protein
LIPDFADLASDSLKLKLEMFLLLSHALNIHIIFIQSELPSLLGIPHRSQLIDQVRVLVSALLNIVQGLVVVFTASRLEIGNVVFHVLELSVELLDRLGVLPLLVLDFISMGFDKSLEQEH